MFLSGHMYLELGVKCSLTHQNYNPSYCRIKHVISFWMNIPDLMEQQNDLA